MAESHQEKLTYRDRLELIKAREGRVPLSKEERLSLLEELYDSLLLSWIENVEGGVHTGSAALSCQLERTRLEMVGLRQNHGTVDATDSGKIIIAYEMDLPLVDAEA